MTAKVDLGFGVLGPLEVQVRGRALAIGSAKRRTVLATLLLNANKPVTRDRLIDALWPAAPPASAVSNLQTYVAALRRGLPGGRARIQTRPAGYTISVGAGELDCRTFEELAARAAEQKAGGRSGEALELLQDALALWRGEPLEDLPAGAAFDADVARLVEGRLAATEQRLELLVTLGSYAEAVVAARDFLEVHPLRERSWHQLMLALYRSGRRAEALHAYQDVRARLVEDLGVEPGPRLRETHQMILADADDGAGALGVCFAHRIADRQPYVDLRGLSADRRPEVLGQFMRALGVDPDNFPPCLRWGGR